MQPQLHISPLGIALATLAAMVLGFLWYGPFFGKAWARELKMPPDFKPETKVFVRALVLQLVGAFLTAFVLAHVSEVWHPSVWNAGSDSAAWGYGLSAGIWTWLGFYLPVQLGSIAWEGKSWRLFFINAGYYLVKLVAMGLILAYLR